MDGVAEDSKHQEPSLGEITMDGPKSNAQGAAVCTSSRFCVIAKHEVSDIHGFWIGERQVEKKSIL